DRLKANGPRISEIFGRLAEAALKIINALAPVSAIMLTVADAFARLINAIPVELLSMIISKFVILKTALLIHGLVIGLTNAFMLLRGALVALGSTSAMVGLIERRMRAMGASAGAINATAVAMRALGRAIMGALLITTIAWGIDAIADRAKGAAPDVDKLSKSLENMAASGRFSGELEKTFGDINGFVDSLKALKSAREELNRQKDPLQSQMQVKNRTNPIGDWVWNQVDKLTKGKDSYEALTEDFKSLDKAFAEMVT